MNCYQKLLPYARCAFSVLFASIWANSTFSQISNHDKPPERRSVHSQAVIPSQYHGHWGMDLRKCDVAPLDKSQTWIKPGSIDFFEMIGPVVQVKTLDGRHVSIITRSEAEGTIFTFKYYLEISSNKNVLNITDEDSSEAKVFYRCPNKAALRLKSSI